jgi:hypothetical protein
VSADPKSNASNSAPEIVAETMVRATPEDYACLMAVARPGEPRAHTYLRAVREAVIPPTILVRYRHPPLFPNWMQMGPLSPLAANTRAQMFIASKWEVEVREVPGAMPAPLWPEDESDEEGED